MAHAGEKRGPRLGDAASLWNFTPSPGWSKEQVAVLRLCLMKYGVGRWVQILDTGLLPGKLIQQLNGQTQRLLGQQSLAAYTGLHVDIDRIRADNELRKDAERKGGLIIWSGPNPTKQMKEQWQRDAKATYGLKPEQLAEVDAALEELAAKAAQQSKAGAQLALVDLMEEPLSSLGREQKLVLLRRLRRKLVSLALSLQAPTAAIGAEVGGEAAVAKLPPAAGSGAETAPRGRASKRAAAPAKPPAKRAKAAPASKRRQRQTSPDEPADETPMDTCETGAAAVAPEAAAAASVARDADVKQLQAMGFSRAKAAEALEECAGDLEAALEWLVTNCI